MKKHEKIKNTAYLRGFAVMFSYLIFFTGCTGADNPFNSESAESTISIDDLNIDVKYAESFDQTTITFSRHWPSGITAGFGKINLPQNGEIMVDYERTSELIAYDENGYLGKVRQFLEGDEKMNMPESAYSVVKANMPSRDSYKNPMIREEMSGGIMRYFDKNGELLSEYPYNEELYRVSQIELDTYKDWQKTSNSENSVQNNMQLLQNQGINFEILDDYYATYSVNASEDFSEDIRFEYTDDLRTGLPVSMVAYKENGRVESIQLNQYDTNTGFPILSKQVIYQYGNVNGEWNIAYRTLMTRQNIQVLTK